MFRLSWPPGFCLQFYLSIFFRRGYYDLYIANKAFPGTAVLLIGSVLLIGPGSRLFSYPDRLVQYRKQLGIVAFFLALFHSLASYYFLPDKFPRETFFTTGWYPYIFGLLAILLLGAIFCISNHWMMNVIGHERWLFLQYWGVRLVFAMIFLHVFVMKFNGWVEWYKFGGAKTLAHPEWPGAGLLLGWFMVVVVLIRLAEFANRSLGRVVWYLGFISLTIIYVITFWWGSTLR